MAKLTFDDLGLHFYETGISDVVLYPKNENNDGYGYSKGVAWNGVTAITQSPEGAEPTDIYADNIKYLTMLSNEEFKGTIEAYTYPDEWEQCDGSAILRHVSGANKGSKAGGLNISAQRRRGFGLVYKTKIGNDILGDDCAYKLHIVYNCEASVSEKQYQTINDSPEAITFSWNFTTRKVTDFDERSIQPAILPIPFKDVSYIEIDSRYVAPKALEGLERILYGDIVHNNGYDAWDAWLLMPEDVYQMCGDDISAEKHNYRYMTDGGARRYMNIVQKPDATNPNGGLWNCTSDNPNYYRPYAGNENPKPYTNTLHPEPGFTLDPTKATIDIRWYNTQVTPKEWVQFNTDDVYFYDAATNTARIIIDGTTGYPARNASLRINVQAAPI